ncbi:hypothetical protein SAMN05216464_105319 [Mucilaginibacter pineti]|uniref:Uncharacterized protein n=1 Tax=Mucilaginibacter pineti TaxID=1391627 RepID=A0A1G7CA49_9SPHI|nr:hypothetical protein [Mucilaginibacter pineti]SDE35285.1 hypothetical protein SAMN05216464_105319 [Mucilaginibacter pineti]
MTDYNAILQTVNGKVYELKGLDSAFHLHQPNSGVVGFYAPEHYNKELFIHLKGGDQFIFEQVPEEVMAALEPEDADIDSVYHQLIGSNQPKRISDAEIIPVDLKELVDVFCQMQYHITTTNGLWATDEPDAFKNHPAHHLLWQIGFELNDIKASSYENRT